MTGLQGALRRYVNVPGSTSIIALDYVKCWRWCSGDVAQVTLVRYIYCLEPCAERRHSLLSRSSEIGSRYVTIIQVWCKYIL